jgi:hypothetical protein
MARKKRSLEPHGSAMAMRHWSWEIDRPLFRVQHPDPDETDNAEPRRAPTPEEDWAVTDSEFQALAQTG